ncbi:Uncharacterised protein [uncultured archaeon]|nr:Uncharacterised protein [uncultured archaeon]
MSFLELFKKKDSAPPALEQKSEEELILGGGENMEVIIPNHVKDAKIAAAEVFMEKKSAKNIFKVTGIYDVGVHIMLTGIVSSGKLKNKMKAKVTNKDIVVEEIKIGSSTVKELLANEEGTVFVKAKHFPVIRVDDEIEFK